MNLLLAISPWAICTINSFSKSIALFCSALYCQIADQSKNVSNQLHSEAMHMIQIWFFSFIFMVHKQMEDSLVHQPLIFQSPRKNRTPVVSSITCDCCQQQQKG